MPLSRGPPPVPGRTVEIPVVYDGADLEAVAQLAGLSAEEVVERHTAAEYAVAFIGFAPGFAYLIGGDERLAVRGFRSRANASPPEVSRSPARTPGSIRATRREAGGSSGARHSPCSTRSGTSPALLASGDRVRFSRR